MQRHLGQDALRGGSHVGGVSPVLDGTIHLQEDGQHAPAPAIPSSHAMSLFLLSIAGTYGPVLELLSLCRITEGPAQANNPIIPVESV